MRLADSHPCGIESQASRVRLRDAFSCSIVNFGWSRVALTPLAADQTLISPVARERCKGPSTIAVRSSPASRIRSLPALYPTAPRHLFPQVKAKVDRNQALSEERDT